MSNGSYTQQKSFELIKEETDRVVVAALGGACLGGSIWGGIGAILGALFGAIAGAARNDQIRKVEDKKLMNETMWQILCGGVSVIFQILYRGLKYGKW